MTPRRVEQSLWIVTSLVAIAGALVLGHQGAAAALPPIRETQRRATGSPARLTRDTRDQLQAILAGDLFRRERQQPDSAASAPATQLATPRPPAPPKPNLTLRGLVGGPPWDAILEGLPGHEGSYVVRAGDSVGGLRIRSVRRDGVTIRGMDTTWLLKLGRAP
jgi:hypothetical protein